MKYTKHARNVYVKRGLKKDKAAILGYPSLREGFKEKVLYLGGNARILANAIIYEGSRIGDNLIMGHNSIIREENTIGNKFSIWNNSIIDYGCKIGNNVKIHSNVYIAQYTIIGDGVFIGPGTTITNDIHPGCKFGKKCMGGPVIKNNVNIGAGVTINPFVIIGENSLIGSGSVVTRDIPANSVAYGSPARVKKKVSDIRCTKGITDFPYRK